MSFSILNLTQKLHFWSDVDELDPTRIERLYDYNRRSKQKHR